MTDLLIRVDPTGLRNERLNVRECERIHLIKKTIRLLRRTQAEKEKKKIKFSEEKKNGYCTHYKQLDDPKLIKKKKNYNFSTFSRKKRLE